MPSDLELIDDLSGVVRTLTIRIVALEERHESVVKAANGLLEYCDLIASRLDSLETIVQAHGMRIGIVEDREIAGETPTES